MPDAQPAITAPVAPVAAPVQATPAPQAPAVNFQASEAAAYEAARAAILADPATPTTEQPTQAPNVSTDGHPVTPAPTGEADPWSLDPALVAPKEPSISERIKARIDARKKQTAPQAPAAPPVQQPITQSNINEYNRLMSEGKPSEALKALGSPHTLEDLQRAELKRLGVLKDAPPDPRVDAATQRLEALEKSIQQQKLAEQQNQQRLAASQAYQADLQEVSKEIVRSGLPGAERFIQLPEVPAMVLQTMVQKELGVLEAAKLVRENVRHLYTNLRATFEPGGAPQEQVAPVGSPATVPSGASSKPVIPPELGYDDAWELTRQLLIEGKL